MSEPALNTDRELYREDTGDPAGSYYENSVFVTEDGSIGMNVGGTVFVQPIADWHAQAAAPFAPDRPYLGLATTRELLDEIRARIETDVAGKGLDYRTVDPE